MRSAGLFIVAAAVSAAGCAGESARHDASSAPAAGTPLAVRGVAVRRVGGSGPTPVPAELRARESATLAPRAPGAVTELPFREGQRVARGDVVARLDDRALRAAELAAETALAAAEADVRRTEALHAREAATPQELEQARSRAAAVQAELDSAREARAYTVLAAPFAGRVAQRPVDVGDVVGPGVPVLVIEGDALELVASVDSARVARLSPGQELDARVDGVPTPVQVKIRSISPSGDPGTHRFEVRADVPRLPELRAGVFARLLLEGEAGESRLVLPASAVFERGGLVGVYVLDEGRARLRWIATGRAAGADVEVRAGLAEGERVAVTPSGLSDGSPVEEPS